MRWIHLSDIHYNPGTEKNRSTNQLGYEHSLV